MLFPHKPPAHAGLRPGSSSWKTLSGAKADQVKEWAGIQGVVRVLNTSAEWPYGHFTVAASDRVYFIKILSNTAAESQIIGDRFARWLESEGVAVSCVLEECPVKVFDGSAAMFIYDHVDGHYCLDNHDLSVLGRALAKLHAAMLNCPWRGQVSEKGRVRHSAIISTLHDFQDGKIGGSIPEDAKELLADDDVFNCLNMLVEKAQVVHGDVNYGNVLFRESDGDAVFLDFENTETAWFSPMMELSFVIERFALVKQNDVSFKNARTVVKAYQDAGGEGFSHPGALSDILKGLSVRALVLLIMVAENGAWSIPKSEWNKFIMLYRQAIERHELLEDIVHG